jgi:hypothetical protein
VKQVQAHEGALKEVGGALFREISEMFEEKCLIEAHPTLGHIQICKSLWLERGLSSTAIIWRLLSLAK